MPTTLLDGQVTQTDFRTAMGLFCTGVAILTTGSGPSTQATTINSFTSISLAPPLVLVGLQTGGRTHQSILEEGVFCISVLRSGDHSSAKSFARRGRPEGWEAFRELGCYCSLLGVAALASALAVLDCAVDRTYQVGDHTIVIATVKDLALLTSDRDPLVFFGGEFTRLPAVDQGRML